MHQLRILATALAVAATLAGCSAAAGHGSAPAPSASDSSQTPPLHSEVDSQYTYTLEDLHSCQVGDALAIAINQAAEPLRVIAVALTITGGSAHRTDQGTYQVAAVQSGFVGEIAASFRLAVLRRLPPKGGTWCAAIARFRGRPGLCVRGMAARPRRAPATVGDHGTDRSLPASRTVIYRILPPANKIAAGKLLTITTPTA